MLTNIVKVKLRAGIVLSCTHGWLVAWAKNNYSMLTIFLCSPHAIRYHQKELDRSYHYLTKINNELICLPILTWYDCLGRLLIYYFNYWYQGIVSWKVRYVTKIRMGRKIITTLLVHCLARKIIMLYLAT